MKQKLRILLIDDDPDILIFLRSNFEKKNFLIETAEDGQTGLNKALLFKPDLILLDVMMPGMDGFQTCLELRKIPELDECVIVFLTALNDDASQIKGFDCGADDFVTKPLKIPVLISRVNALLRKKIESYEEKPEISVSGIVVNRERFTVTVDGNEIYLPLKEFELLYMFISNPGRIFSRGDILNSIWPKYTYVGDRTIDVHIRKLREKIGDNFIETVKGEGYAFVKNKDESM